MFNRVSCVTKNHSETKQRILINSFPMIINTLYTFRKKKEKQTQKIEKEKIDKRR